MIRNSFAIMFAVAMLAPAVAVQAATSGPALTRAGHKLAQCLYSKRKADVLGALNAASADQAKRFSRTLRNGTACRDVTVTTREIEGGSIVAPEDVLRGMLAEAALGRIHAVSSLAPVTGATSYWRSWFVATGRHAAVDEMAVCTAEVNPGAVLGLLKTAPDSAEELATAQSLSATLGPCLPQGATLKANRQSLRAALAEALYHRAAAPAMAVSR